MYDSWSSDFVFVVAIVTQVWKKNDSNLTLIFVSSASIPMKVEYYENQ